MWWWSWDRHKLYVLGNKAKCCEADSKSNSHVYTQRSIKKIIGLYLDKHKTWHYSGHLRYLYECGQKNFFHKIKKCISSNTKWIILTSITYSLANQHTHRVDNAGTGSAVHTSTQGQQKTSLRHEQSQNQKLLHSLTFLPYLSASPQVVPQPAGWS